MYYPVEDFQSWLFPDLLLIGGNYLTYRDVSWAFYNTLVHFMQNFLLYILCRGCEPPETKKDIPPKR